MGERLGVVRASDDRLAIRFEKGPAKKKVREHHETGTLPITYYLADGAGAEDAATFLQKSYPNGGGPLMPPAAPTKSAIYMRVSKDDGSQESDKEAYAAYTLMRWGIF